MPGIGLHTDSVIPFQLVRRRMDSHKATKVAKIILEFWSCGLERIEADRVLDQFGQLGGQDPAHLFHIWTFAIRLSLPPCRRFNCMLTFSTYETQYVVDNSSYSV